MFRVQLNLIVHALESITHMYWLICYANQKLTEK